MPIQSAAKLGHSEFEKKTPPPTRNEKQKRDFAGGRRLSQEEAI